MLITWQSTGGTTMKKRKRERERVRERKLRAYVMQSWTSLRMFMFWIDCWSTVFILLALFSPHNNESENATNTQESIERANEFNIFRAESFGKWEPEKKNHSHSTNYAHVEKVMCVCKWTYPPGRTFYVCRLFFIFICVHCFPSPASHQQQLFVVSISFACLFPFVPG